MTSEQYKLLLQDLARVSGLADSSALLSHGRVKIGDLNALLEHDAGYDEHLLQVRILLGPLPESEQGIATKALLEANYISGYGGECVFSLYPESSDVVITLRIRLEASMSPQELWQQLSDVSRHGSKMWDEVVSKLKPSGDSMRMAFDPMQTQGLVI
jgi:hypothetical protein